MYIGLRDGLLFQVSKQLLLLYIEMDASADLDTLCCLSHFKVKALLCEDQ